MHRSPSVCYYILDIQYRCTANIFRQTRRAMIMSRNLECRLSSARSIIYSWATVSSEDTSVRGCRRARDDWMPRGGGESEGSLEERWFIRRQHGHGGARETVAHDGVLCCDVIRLSGTLTSRHTVRCKQGERRHNAASIAEAGNLQLPSPCPRTFLRPTSPSNHLSPFRPPTPIHPTFIFRARTPLSSRLIMSAIIRPPVPNMLRLTPRCAIISMYNTQPKGKELESLKRNNFLS